MKLVSFSKNGTPRIGTILGETDIIDLGRAWALYKAEAKNVRFDMPDSMIGLLQTGDDGLGAVRTVRDFIETTRKTASGKLREVVRNLESVKLEAPIQNPRKIICLGRNYAEHAKEGGAEAPGRPMLFCKAPTAIIGPGDPVIYPKITSQLDYEIELAVVIGKKGKEIPEETAYDYVAGYMILNDVSARDLQQGDRQWFRGKSLDTFAPTGPWIVLKDEIPDPGDLKMQMKVNGELRQDSSTKHMIFKVPQIIAFISEGITLEPGDIISTGTPSGVGVYMKPEPKLLKVGDRMEAWIEKIGVLKNTVGQ
jgi:2-keto-4-pentenoate hydratase/2-oxohepta-3-ene-1,7-dioic acid hydratase in catechol pathway